MSKTLIGIVTFGNLPFTQLTIRSIRETTRSPFDFFVVVGDPNDNFTPQWLEQEGIDYLWHRNMNRGFPSSLNDIYDYAWPLSGYHYDKLILAGNDVVPYPNGVDALIHVADKTDWEWCCSSQFDVKSLCDRYPEARQYFDGDKFLFGHFGRDGLDSRPLVRPWECHNGQVPLPDLATLTPDCISDVRNLCLFKRSVFDKIGYADANFWPGGYFEDNDYCKRARLAGVRACRVPFSAYFHFWSRTIHQGNGTSSPQFQNNANFYQEKWGGPFDAEKFALPFAGNPFGFSDPSREVNFLFGDGQLRIGERQHESAIAAYWKSKC